MVASHTACNQASLNFGPMAKCSTIPATKSMKRVHGNIISLKSRRKKQVTKRSHPEYPPRVQALDMCRNVAKQSIP